MVPAAVELDGPSGSQPAELSANAASAELQADLQIMELSGDTGAEELEAKEHAELEGDIPKKCDHSPAGPASASATTSPPP